MKYMFCALFFVFTTSQAHAHERVISSAVGDKQINITFNEPFALTTIRVSSTVVSFDTKYRYSKIDWVTDHQIAVEPFPKGKFTVEWRGLAKDGHTIKGEFDFSVDD